MIKARFVAAVCVISLLVGCAGVGVVSSNDPLRKLNDAGDLYSRQNRPMPAERLIREAIAIYEQQNDALGQGHAYRQYAELLRSSSVKRWEKVYRRDGFQDKSITFENRITKSDEFLQKAISYYKQAEKSSSESSQFDTLTNVYYNMAWSHYMLKEKKKACASFDKALEAYSENMRNNPNAKPIAHRGKTVQSSIELDKKNIGCK